MVLHADALIEDRPDHPSIKEPARSAKRFELVAFDVELEKVNPTEPGGLCVVVKRGGWQLGRHLTGLCDAMPRSLRVVDEPQRGLTQTHPCVECASQHER